MRGVSFHHFLELDGQGPLAAFVSEIVEGASDRHHLIDHPHATVAKFVSQDPQPFHRGQGMLHRNSVGSQQTVESAMAPMPPPRRVERERGLFRTYPWGWDADFSVW